MGIFSYNKHLNFKENMWKLKLKVCLINFLAYSLCTFLLYLCFQRQALYRRDFGFTAIGYMYKQKGENSGFSPSIVSLPDPLFLQDELLNEKQIKLWNKYCHLLLP